MTAAPAIEIGTETGPAPAQGKALHAAHAARTAAAAHAAFPAAAADGAPSFRTGWQSLLASMGAGGTGGEESARGAPASSPPAMSDSTSVAAARLADSAGLGSQISSSQILASQMKTGAGTGAALAETVAEAADGKGLSFRNTADVDVQTLGVQPGATGAAGNLAGNEPANSASAEPAAAASKAAREAGEDRTAETESKSGHRRRPAETTHSAASSATPSAALSSAQPGTAPAAILGLQPAPVAVSPSVQTPGANSSTAELADSARGAREPIAGRASLRAASSSTGAQAAPAGDQAHLDGSSRLRRAERKGAAEAGSGSAGTSKAQPSAANGRSGIDAAVDEELPLAGLTPASPGAVETTGNLPDSVVSATGAGSLTALNGDAPARPAEPMAVRQEGETAQKTASGVDPQPAAAAAQPVNFTTVSNAGRDAGVDAEAVSGSDSGLNRAWGLTAAAQAGVSAAPAGSSNASPNASPDASPNAIMHRSSRLVFPEIPSAAATPSLQPQPAQDSGGTAAQAAARLAGTSPASGGAFGPASGQAAEASALQAAEPDGKEAITPTASTASSPGDASETADSRTVLTVQTHEQGRDQSGMRAVASISAAASIASQAGVPATNPGSSPAQALPAEQSTTLGLSTESLRAVKAGHGSLPMPVAPATVPGAAAMPGAGTASSPIPTQIPAQSMALAAIEGTNSAPAQTSSSGGTAAALPSGSVQTPALVSASAQMTGRAGSDDSLQHVPAASSAASLQNAPLPAGPDAPTGQAGNKPVSQASGTNSRVGAVRPVSGTGRTGLTGEAKEINEGQSAGPAVGAMAMMRDSSGQSGTGNAGGDAGGRSDARSGPTPGETFAALDADSGAVQPTWVHAGAQQAEAGYQDPTLGWVSVRADMSGGGVHAELVAGSADAAQALSGHMEGLNAYLADHHTPVETLTLSSPASGWSGMGGQAGSGQGMQQNSGEQGAGQQMGQGVDAGFRANSAPIASQETATVELAAWAGGVEAGAQAGSSGGAYISVMA